MLTHTQVAHTHTHTHTTHMVQAVEEQAYEAAFKDLVNTAELSVGRGLMAELNPK